MSPDPIFAAAEAWRKARADFVATSEREAIDDQRLIALLNEECRQSIKVLRTAPTTLPGLLLFCEMGAEMSRISIEAGGGMGDWTPGGPIGVDAPTGEEMFIEALVKAARALIAAPASLPTVPYLGGSDDPALAAIEKHRALWLVANSVTDDTDEAGDPEWQAFREFLRTPPTSPNGLAAYLDYIESDQGFGHHSLIDDSSARAVIGCVRQYVGATR